MAERSGTSASCRKGLFNRRDEAAEVDASPDVPGEWLYDRMFDGVRDAAYREAAIDRRANAIVFWIANVAPPSGLLLLQDPHDRFA
jgi:hypothetical protein